MGNDDRDCISPHPRSSKKRQTRTRVQSLSFTARINQYIPLIKARSWLQCLYTNPTPKLDRMIHTCIHTYILQQPLLRLLYIMCICIPSNHVRHACICTLSLPWSLLPSLDTDTSLFLTIRRAVECLKFEPQKSIALFTCLYLRSNFKIYLPERAEMQFLAPVASWNTQCA